MLTNRTLLWSLIIICITIHVWWKTLNAFCIALPECTFMISQYASVVLCGKSSFYWKTNMKSRLRHRVQHAVISHFTALYANLSYEVLPETMILHSGCMKLRSDVYLLRINMLLKLTVWQYPSLQRQNSSFTSVITSWLTNNVFPFSLFFPNDHFGVAASYLSCPLKLFWPWT